MSQSLPSSTPELNRLGAAIGLIPIIESGLRDGKLTTERAALMASFCEWALTVTPGDDDAPRLAEAVVKGLQRLRLQMEMASKMSIDRAR
jgi:hypothetical protein